jgi:predicted CoA-substrate-specific enzyme activase
MDEHFAGIDVGTSYVKSVIINADGQIKGSNIVRTGSDLQASIEESYQSALQQAGLTVDEITSTISTGFGRQNATFATGSKTEISCHAKGAYNHFPRKMTIIDIGGQDTKVIKIDEQGKRVGFKMNRKCAAGTGAFLEDIASKLRIEQDEMNDLAKSSGNDTSLGSYCTVFASTEILTRIKNGEKVEDLVRSAFESVARRVIEMDVLDDAVVLTGGVIAHNDAFLTILDKFTKGDILVAPNPQLIGALGAALYAKEMSN